MESTRLDMLGDIDLAGSLLLFPKLKHVSNAGEALVTLDDDIGVLEIDSGSPSVWGIQTASLGRVLIVYGPQNGSATLTHNISGTPTQNQIYTHDGEDWIMTKGSIAVLVGTSVSGGAFMWRMVGHAGYRAGNVAMTPGTVGAASQYSVTTTVTGALIGDYVEAFYHGADLNQIILHAYVQASNTVEIVMSNPTAGGIAVGDGTCYVRVYRRRNG